VCGGGAGGVMDPAFCSDLATRPRQHHKQCPHGLGIGENIALCAESTLGLIPPQCLRIPLPLLAEESCGRVVADHILSTATLKIIPRLHLERGCKGAGIKV